MAWWARPDCLGPPIEANATRLWETCPVCVCMLTAHTLLFLESDLQRGGATKTRQHTCFCILRCAFSFAFFFLARGLTHFFALHLAGVYLGGGVEPCVKNIPTVNYECVGLRARTSVCTVVVWWWIMNKSKLLLPLPLLPLLPLLLQGERVQCKLGTRGQRAKMGQWWRAFD